MGKRIAKRKAKRKSLWKRTLPFVVFFGGLSLVAFSAQSLWTDWRDDVAAQSEYSALREQFESKVEPHIKLGAELGPQADARLDMRHFAEINPDFAGWISIPGTALSYPLVQGPDNRLYLNTTFSGERNPAGAIFLDYRAGQGFDTPLAILYGHNMRDGSLFAPLIDYLQPPFLREHSEIVIVTAAGEILVYQVFYARETEAWDSIYTLDFNDSAAVAAFFDTAPPGASRFLVLATCPLGSRDTRVLVYAALLT